jgi:hypothetical protein
LSLNATCCPLLPARASPLAARAPAPAITTDSAPSTALRPMSFDRLREGDPREAARELASAAERRKLDGIRLTRVTRGRAIAAAVIEDLAREEADIGFISESEYNHLSKDAELYADVARLHSYLSAVSTGRAKGDGCKYCTSTSSYVCTSTSCNITIGSRKVAAASREAP